MSFEGYKKDSRDIHLNPKEGKEQAGTLESLLEKYKDQRVLVLAPPSVGKSTILQHIKDGVDLDVVFDDMPEEFKRHVLHHEWPFMFVDGDRKAIKYTEKEFDPNNIEHQDYLRETTELLTDYVQSKMNIEAGHPGFGSTLVDSDVVIYLKISEEELEKRIESRNKNTHRLVQIERVKAIKKNLEVDLVRFKSEGGVVEEITID
ncbi:MAG: hypothetical protein HYV45_01170 [Candidatus Moranbacteria bacterium]|nr:hypothetical protein [Candidatus Moranbacteria bacterium]